MNVVAVSCLAHILHIVSYGKAGREKEGGGEADEDSYVTCETGTSGLTDEELEPINRHQLREA